MQMQNGEISKKFAAVIKERFATLLDDYDVDTVMQDDPYNKLKILYILLMNKKLDINNLMKFPDYQTK